MMKRKMVNVSLGTVISKEFISLEFTKTLDKAPANELIQGLTYSEVLMKIFSITSRKVLNT